MTKPTVAQHFDAKPPELRAIYDYRQTKTSPVFWPVLSPDGQTLLGGVHGDNIYPMAKDLGLLSIAGGPPRELKIDMDWPTDDGFVHGINSWDWSPDGKKIAFTTWSVKEELFLMKNVLPAK